MTMTNGAMKVVCAFLTLATSTLAIAPEAHAGATGGPWYGQGVVLPGATRSQRVKFDGGATAAVSIRGDGSTDLDFYVYDSNGNLVASDEDATDVTMLSWTPRWTGYFYISIVNRGGQENQFVLSTN
jgi:hypothetical protein